MRIKDRFFLSLSVLLLLIVSACEDPSSVGLVDDAGGNAIVESLPLTNFGAEPVSGVNSGTNVLLLGQVDDPILGPITATGYLDFALEARPAVNYLNGEVDSLFLNLLVDVDYSYGDPNEDITIDVFEVTSNFDIVTEREDLPGQEAVPLFQISINPGSLTSATDTLLTFPFPDSWVQENNQLLRPALLADDSQIADNAFNNDFHGIRLVPSSGNAFVRILATRTNSFLQGLVITEDDTDSDLIFNYGASSDISAYERSGDPQIPAGRALLQSDVGSNIELNIDFSQVTNESSVNRAALEMRFDTTTFVASDDFVRPVVGNLTLVGIVPDSLQGTDPVNEACGARSGDIIAVCFLSESRIIDNSKLIFDSRIFREEIERRSFGTEFFERYEVRFPTPNEANAIFLHDMSSPENQPSFVFTYTVLN